MSQDTLVNGNRYSFTNIAMEWSDVTGGGAEFARGVFKSINYDASQDPGIVQGNQIAPVGRTTGYATGSGSFEMLISESDDFFSSLTGDGNVPIMSADFNLAVSYSVNDIDVRTDQLMGVRITKLGQSNSQGNDATMVSCDFSIMKMYRNGILMYGDPDS
jgi:hypothetical protein